MKRRILIADDSTTIRRVVEHTFAGTDVAVTSAADGVSALALARETGPEVVLCDVLMPGPSGYEIAETLSRDPAFAGVPVLLLTGAFEPFDEARATASGAAGFLAKPFESQVLRDRVLELLASRPPAPPPATPAPPPAPGPAPADEPPDPAPWPVAAPAEAATTVTRPIVIPVSRTSSAPPRLVSVLSGRHHEPVRAPGPAPAPVPEPAPAAPFHVHVHVEKEKEEAPDLPGSVDPAAALAALADEEPLGDFGVTARAWGSPRVALPGDEDFDLSRPSPVAAGVPQPPQPAPAARSDAFGVAGTLRDDVRRELLALAPDILREIAWEVLPDLLERLLREGLPSRPSRDAAPRRAGSPGDSIR
jgi:CheY-like chemotaxis protein